MQIPKTLQPRIKGFLEDLIDEENAKIVEWERQQTDSRIVDLRAGEIDQATTKRASCQALIDQITGAPAEDASLFHVEPFPAEEHWPDDLARAISAYNVILAAAQGVEDELSPREFRQFLPSWSHLVQSLAILEQDLGYAIDDQRALDEREAELDRDHYAAESASSRYINRRVA